MAFSSQSFTAPKISKMNFSSPLSSSAAKISGTAPKLSRSRIKFRARGVSSPIVGAQSSIENTLVETNTILVEIQKQLALDFSMRIAEESAKNKQLKQEKSRSKFALKESAIESSKKIGGIVKSATGKILSPVKGVFDKIVEFLTTIGTGIAVNAAFEWLSKEENREQLNEWFGWVGKNWKWVAAAVAGILLLNPILNIIGAIGGAIALIRTAIDIFSWARKKMFPKTPSTPKSPTTSPSGPGGPRGGFGGGTQMGSPGRYRLQGQARVGGFRLEQQRMRATATNLGNIPRTGGPQALLALLGSIGLSVGSNFLSGKIRENRMNALVEKYNESSKEDKSKMLSVIKEDLQKEKDYGQSFGGKMDDVVNFITGGRSVYKGRISFMEEFLSRVEARAMGGPVSSGSPYIVGERGPEFFIPNINGSVMSNYKTEKIYDMISSKNAGKINFVNMDLPPIDMRQEKSIPTPPAPPVPNIPSTNSADLWRTKTPDIYGIYV